MTLPQKIEQAAKEYTNNESYQDWHCTASEFSEYAEKDFTAGANLLLPDYERLRDALRKIRDHNPEYDGLVIDRELETIKDLL